MVNTYKNLLQDLDADRVEPDFIYKLLVAGLPSDVYVEVRRLCDPPADDAFRWGELDTDTYEVLYIKAMPIDVGDFTVVHQQT